MNNKLNKIIIRKQWLINDKIDKMNLKLKYPPFSSSKYNWFICKEILHNIYTLH